MDDVIIAGSLWENASTNAFDITERVGELFGAFVEYINFLNQESEKDKKDNRLSEARFDKTAQVILVMNNRVMGDLYSRLQSIFRSDAYASLIDNLTDRIKDMNAATSQLKTKLYEIYGAKQERDNKITILFDPPVDPLGGKEDRKRSEDKDDPLENIPPSLAEMEKR